MLDREDITFATCYQLAGEIREQWVDRPVEVSYALNWLSQINEPEDIFDTFHEPAKQVPLLMDLCKVLEFVLINSDGWQSQSAEMIKKELVQRIKEYGRRSNEITEPSFEAIYIKL